MDKLEFTVALKDLISDAAKQAGVSLDKLTTELGHVEKSTGHLDKNVEKLEFHHILTHASREVVAGFKEMVGGIRGLNIESVLGGATEAAAGFAKSLDLIAPGLGSVASLAVRATGGVVELGLAMVDTALEVTEVNEKLSATFEALGGAPGAGAPTLAFLNELSTQLPQSRTQLAEWTKQYEAMGITDLGELRDQIRATASAQAIMGDTGAAAYQKLTERINIAIETHTGLKLPAKSLKGLYEAGINVTDVADRVGVSTKELAAQLKAGTVNAEKFGDAMKTSLLEKGEKPLEAMGNEIGTLKTKFGETISHLFDDIDTTPILDAIKSVIDLGDQGEPSGKALGDGVKSGVNAIVKEIGHLIHEGEIMFLDLEIGWLKNKKGIGEFISDAKILGGVLVDIAKVVGKIVDGVASASVAIGGIAGKGIFAVTDAAANEAARNRAGVGGLDPAMQKVLDKHASGGIVAGIHGGIATVRPAAGEGLVSIGAGERIVPQDAYRHVTHAMTMPGNDNSRGGGSSHSVHIEHLHVEAPSGVTHAQDITVTGLTLALERLQLASGR